MPTTKEERAASARVRKETLRARKLHAIAERRASAAKLDKADFIAAIVKGEFRPITAEDIAAEPNPD
jgi:hypothetical protein